MIKQQILGIAFFLATITGFAQQKTGDKSMIAGRKVYENVCQVCHQENGEGVPKMNPPLIKTSWVLGDKSRLIGVVLKGLQEPIEINEERYNIPMPAQSHLSDTDIANVLTYIRQSFGNSASAIKPSEVKAQRKNN
jgi:mono/diheme cytochrome c family protein